MNEETPKNTENSVESEKERLRREEREQNNAGFKLVEEDNADSERGPIARKVRTVRNAAFKNFIDKGPLSEDFIFFQKLFLEHLGFTEAYRYRLFHIIIGSSPPWNADLFDAEGKWSIAEAMRKLAEKYHIDIEKV